MRIYPELLVDQEFKSLGDQGFMGTLNDRQFAFLRSKGYVNALADMMTSWLSYSPANLFALNEPGIWLDPSDVANLDWRRNLLTYTEQFDNAAWTKTRSSISANAAVAPDGTTTADKLVEDTTATSSHNTTGAVLTFASASTTTISLYVKAAERTWCRIADGGVTSGGAFVDLSSGQFGTIEAGVTASSIQNVGNGWYRVSITGVLAGTSSQMLVQVATGNGTTSYTGNGTSGILIWGAQLELGSVATDYQRISDVNTEVLERFPRTTMYQDRAGSTAVTTPGQSVGLRLDKSKGLVLGSELVTNGDFSAGSTGWSAQSGWTIGSGVASVNSSVAGSTYLRTSGFSAVAGAYYRVTFTVTSYTSGSVFAVAGTGPSASSATAVGTYSFLVQASGTGGVGLLAFGSTTVATVDNISVKELPGFHAVANSDAARGIYGIEPVGGRRNLLDRTEEFENAYWTKQELTVVQNAGSAPDGTFTADRLVPTAVSSTHQINRLSLVTSQACAISFYLKASGYNTVEVLDGTSATNGATFDGSSGTVTNKGTGVGSMVALPDGWYRCTLLVTTTGVRFYVPTSASNFTGNGTSGILIWGAQLETGSTATAYQRVTTQYDVTEVGKQTLHYVQYDGSDDGYVTPTITPGIDKVQVFAGVRKLSDAAGGVLAELSVARGTNAGSFTFFAPPSAAAEYQFRSRGSVDEVSPVVASGFAAPITNVLAGLGDIAGDRSTIRVNGTQIAQGTSEQGTGNYLAYPIYIGRRGGVDLSFNGRDYGIITRFGANLDASTIAATESWLNQKTGAF